MIQVLKEAREGSIRASPAVVNDDRSYEEMLATGNFEQILDQFISYRASTTRSSEWVLADSGSSHVVSQKKPGDAGGEEVNVQLAGGQKTTAHLNEHGEVLVDNEATEDLFPLGRAITLLPDLDLS
jgi:hypothetical protein